MRTARLYLDTNVFVAAYETEGIVSADAWWLLDLIERGLALAYTSELTLAELLTGPLINDQADLVDTYQALITDSPSLTVIPVSQQVLVEAAHLRVGLRTLRLPDAIHLASAVLRNCSYLVSGDLRLPEHPTCARLRLGTEDFSRFQLTFEPP